MPKCQECKSNNTNVSGNEFNKNLCDDCYTEYRATIQHLFDLKDLYEVDDLLNNISLNGTDEK